MSEAQVPHFLLATPLSKYAKNHSLTAVLAVLATEDANKVATPTIAVFAGMFTAEMQNRVNAVKNGPFAIYHDSELERGTDLLHALSAARTKPLWHLFRSDTCSKTYMSSWHGVPTAAISDDFNRRDRNQDYAQKTDEAFSNAIENAYADGHGGFGDFTTNGDFYSPKGGRPGAVAIHLTYRKSKSDGIWIRHFVSRNVDRAAQVAPKFMDAAGQLLNFAGSSFSFSTAVDALRDSHGRGHFPGLPTLKKWSIQHHIELMMHQLSRR